MTSVRGIVPAPFSARRAPPAGDAPRSPSGSGRRSLAEAIAAWVGGDIAATNLPQLRRFHQGLFPTNLDDARTLLATISTALLTFTGVVFSITLVALQMASTQYSPRVLRTFVRKPVTKLALSTFIATFVYSLTLLSRIGTASTARTVAQGAGRGWRTSS